MRKSDQRVPGFGEWLSPDKPSPVPRSRESYAGLTPEAAAHQLVEELGSLGGHRRITLRNRRSALASVLKAFRDRGKDLATLTSKDCLEYHAYLRDLIQREFYSEDTCSNLVRGWNATMRAIFQIQDEPGSGIILKSFRQKPAKRTRLTQEEFDAMINALDKVPFRWMLYRAVFAAYLEIAWCAGPRIGSLLEGRVLVSDVDPLRGTIVLRHMKNAAYLPHDEDHVIVLTHRATAAVKRLIESIEALPIYRGATNTPLFIGPTGDPVTSQWVNRNLKILTDLVGVRKRVTTHVLRKTAGTLIAAKNPKLAWKQLGVSEEIGNRHYNFPILEDRLGARHLLPGATNLDAAPELPSPTPHDDQRPRPPWEPNAYR